MESLIVHLLCAKLIGTLTCVVSFNLYSNPKIHHCDLYISGDKTELKKLQ